MHDEAQCGWADSMEAGRPPGPTNLNGCSSEAWVREDFVRTRTGTHFAPEANEAGSATNGSAGIAENGRRWARFLRARSSRYLAPVGKILDLSVVRACTAKPCSRLQVMAGVSKRRDQ